MAGDDRAVVKTYVPTYQKAQWADHANELDMSLSEFVRTMVQAGRRDFELAATGGDIADAERADDESPRDVQERIIAELRSEAPLGWDELVHRLTDGIADDIDTALDILQDNNQVRHRGRRDGYVLLDDE